MRWEIEGEVKDDTEDLTWAKATAFCCDRKDERMSTFEGTCMLYLK